MARKADSGAPLSRMTESEWRDTSQLIKQTLGIKLSEAKRVFLISRLLKRLRATGARSFREYLELVSNSKTFFGEHQELVNAVTTNKTDFFREPEHFDVLRRWLRSKSPRVHRARSEGVRVWCAAASTGEEPYTIATVLRDELMPLEYERAQIVASDIDTRVLETARRGVYHKTVVQEVAPSLHSRMFVQGSGAYRDQFRIRRELRERVRFCQQNLIAPHWDVGMTFDLVFCRNVLIYFDRPTQEQVVARLLQRVEPYGLLFLGHSESLSAMGISAIQVAHSVCRPNVDGALRSPRVPSFSPASRSLPPAPRLTARRETSPPPAPPSVPTGFQAEPLRAGESRFDSPKWQVVTLEASLLLVLFAEAPQVTLLAHLESTEPGPLRQRVRESVVSMAELLGESPDSAPRLHAKVIHDGDSASDAIQTELQRLEVVISSTKQVPPGSQLWLEPKSYRILLRKPSTRPARRTLRSTSAEPA